MKAYLDTELARGRSYLPVEQLLLTIKTLDNKHRGGIMKKADEKYLDGDDPSFVLPLELPELDRKFTVFRRPIFHFGAQFTT